jgi:hypothetical protein
MKVILAASFLLALVGCSYGLPSSQSHGASETARNGAIFNAANQQVVSAADLLQEARTFGSMALGSRVSCSDKTVSSTFVSLMEAHVNAAASIDAGRVPNLITPSQLRQAKSDLAGLAAKVERCLGHGDFNTLMQFSQLHGELATDIDGKPS